MSRYALCAAVLASLLIAACGGSGHSSSSPSSTTSATSTAATSSATTATSTVSAGPTTTTAATSSRPPEVPKNRIPTRPPRHSKPTAPNTDVRIPAAFVIGAGGAVTPPLISAPANVTIELQLHNQDAKAHRVTLSVPHFAGVTVPAHRTTTTDVTGVPKGTFRLLIDGAPKARIVVGAVPGP